MRPCTARAARCSGRSATPARRQRPHALEDRLERFTAVRMSSGAGRDAWSMATAPSTTAAPRPSRGRKMLNKVPEVTIFFWVIKIMCTTVGETAADYLNENLGLGLSKTTYLAGALLVALLIVQFPRKRYVVGTLGFERSDGRWSPSGGPERVSTLAAEACTVDVRRLRPWRARCSGPRAWSAHPVDRMAVRASTVECWEWCACAGRCDDDRGSQIGSGVLAGAPSAVRQAGFAAHRAGRRRVGAAVRRADRVDVCDARRVAAADAHHRGRRRRVPGADVQRLS